MNATNDADADAVPDETPTRTSTTVAAVAALLFVAVLLSRTGNALVPALVGVGSVLTLAVSLELVGLSRWHTPGTVVASLLTLPIAAGLAVSSFGTILVLLGSLFPVPQPAQIPGQSLELVGRLGVVVGALLGVLGTGLGVRGALSAKRLARYCSVTARTAVVPVCVAVLAIGGTILSIELSADPGATGETLVAGVLDWLLAPGGATTHVGSLLLLVAATTETVRAALGALPVAELLADSGAGETRERRVARVRAVLGTVTTVAFVAGVLAAVVEARINPIRLRRTLGPGPYGFLRWLTSVGFLRFLLIVVTALSAVSVAASTAIRRFARASVGGVVRLSTPLAVGAAVTVGAVLFADAVYATLLGVVIDILPAVLAEETRTVAAAVAGTYGPNAVVVGLTAALIVLTGLVAVSLWGALRFGYLSSGTGGYALAAAGLFAGSAFAGTLDAPAWLVFGGVATSLLVWDAGSFGVTLGREIGSRAPTGRAELVHVGGTVVVGLVGVLVAAGVTRLSGGPVQQSPAAVVALVSVLLGIVLLTAALR
jgi:hypothetical protein